MYLGLSEQIASQSRLNGLDRFICALFAVYCAWSVADGLSTGTISLKFSTIRRSEMPPLFWFGMAMHCAVGVGFIIVAITGTPHW